MTGWWCGPRFRSISASCHGITDLLNVLDAKDNEIEYFYASRLRNKLSEASVTATFARSSRASCASLPSLSFDGTKATRLRGKRLEPIRRAASTGVRFVALCQKPDRLFPTLKLPSEL